LDTPKKLGYLLELAKQLLLLIPPGKVTTYKAIAEILGVHPRVAGMLVKMNNEPIVVPCHRVVRSNGELGGYSLGGAYFKRRLLELEGVKFCDNSNRVCEEFILKRLL